MYVFRLEPEPADFVALADHIAGSEEEQVHSALWSRRGIIVERLKAVAARGSVVDTDRAIYNAMRLLVY